MTEIPIIESIQIAPGTDVHAQLRAAVIELEARGALDPVLAEYLIHADNRPCHESYGWCFAHMAKALPPDHPVPSLTYSVGPFDAQEGSHGAE